MSSHPLNKRWLTAELMRVKSGYADWACNPKADKKRSLDELVRLADKRQQGAVQPPGHESFPVRMEHAHGLP